MSVPDTVRHKSNQVISESYLEVGYNYRMTDIQGAIGREQLKRLPQIMDERRKQVQHYRGLLEDIPKLILPIEPEWARSNWQSLCVRLPKDCRQQQIMQYMLDEGVATRRGIMCIHREPAYNENYGRMTLPISEEAQHQCIILPLYPKMTESEIERVVSVLSASLQL